MTVLVAVVDNGGFTAAARALGLPLPTVSRKLAELESHLGTRLLNRSTRRIALTDAGQAALIARANDWRAYAAAVAAVPLTRSTHTLTVYAVAPSSVFDPVHRAPI